MQIWSLEFPQCLFLLLQSVHNMNGGAWEPGEQGLALSTVPLAQLTSQLVTAHHLTEKLPFSSCIARWNSWNQTIDYPLTVVGVVFHQTLWDSPYNFILPAKSICQGFLSLDTHLTGKVFCQKFSVWVFSWPHYTNRLCYTRTCTVHCYVSFTKSFPCLFLLLISVHYLIALQNSEEIILQVI